MSNRTTGNLELAKAKLSTCDPEVIVSEYYDANLQAIDEAVSDLQDSGGGSGEVQKATVTLTANQIKALHATPVQIVAAPGANKAFQIQGATLQYNHVTTDYTTPPGSRLELGAHDAVINDYSTWETNTQPSELLGGKVDAIDYGVLQMGVGQGAVGGNLIPKSYLDNQPLVIGNPGDDFTDGDGTLTITVYYTVMDLA